MNLPSAHDVGAQVPIFPRVSGPASRSTGARTGERRPTPRPTFGGNRRGVDTARPGGPAVPGGRALSPGARRRTPASPTSDGHSVDRGDVANLALLVALAVALRAPGLTSHGLYPGDAWPALATRTDVRQAMRLGVTVPASSWPCASGWAPAVRRSGPRRRSWWHRWQRSPACTSSPGRWVWGGSPGWRRGASWRCAP